MKVKVYNDNVHPYKETFKGENIYIEPKSFIYMDEDEAHQFRGSYKAPVLNVDGVHMPEGFKMIRVVRETDAPEPQAKIDTLKCMACSYKAASKADLAEHEKASHEVFTDEAAEQEIKARKKAKA